MSNDIAELARYVVAHAESLAMAPERYRAILSRITHDGAGPGSWVHEWSEQARALESDGQLLEASQYYTFARFPFVDAEPRRAALAACVRAVDVWRRRVPGIERLDVDVAGGRVGAWTSDLSADEPRPLLLISGGIVSLKEQWAPVLLAARQLGLAGLVTEMPRVGENTCVYSPDSWRMLPGLVDAVAGSVRSSEVYVMAMSFSGREALRWAAEDPRVRGVITTGAPVHGPFADPDVRRRLPAITRDTLAHMAGAADPDLGPLALDADLLGTVDVPVRYVASLRDEIVPPGDLELLRAHVRDLDVLEHDDVHGAPRHAAKTRDWMIAALAGIQRPTTRRP